MSSSAGGSSSRGGPDGSGGSGSGGGSGSSAQQSGDAQGGERPATRPEEADSSGYSSGLNYAWGKAGHHEAGCEIDAAGDKVHKVDGSKVYEHPPKKYKPGSNGVVDNERTAELRARTRHSNERNGSVVEGEEEEED